MRGKNGVQEFTQKQQTNIMKQERGKNKMIKKDIIKKTVSLALTFAMMAGCGIIESDNCSKINASEKKQNYIIQTSSGRELDHILRVYDEIESVTEAANDELVDENMATVLLNKYEVEELKEDADIVSIEKDKVVKAAKEKNVKKINGKDIDLEWNKKLIKCKSIKDDDVKKRVKIAVIDSGVDWGNDIDLEETITLMPGEEEMNPLFMDGTGHGNSVAGLIAAKDNNEGITGINPNAAIYSIRVLDDNNESPLSRVIDGIYYAISKKVDIINMSFGLDSYSEALKKAIDAAENAGILVVAAAGNTSANVQYPAAYDSVLAVGSVDSDADLADSSARGERIDVVAPGELVCSTGQFGDLLIESGTSLAAPQVAAVASRIMEENPNASNTDVKNAIIHGANYSNGVGYGLLDEKYVLENYDELIEYDNDKVIEVNDTEIDVLGDTGCVKGSWSGDKHETLIGSGHSNVKKGARFPDIKDPYLDGSVLGVQMYRFAGMMHNPWWHGYYQKGKVVGNNPKYEGEYFNNYVACYIYITRLANEMKTKKVANAPLGLTSDIESEIKYDLGSLDWQRSYGYIPTGETERAFVWGMALHSLADAFAHSVFVNGHVITHDTGADNINTCKQRWNHAKIAVDSGMEMFKKGNSSGTYKEFNIVKQASSYKMVNIKKHMNSLAGNSVASGYSAVNKDVSLSSGN